MPSGDSLETWEGIVDQKLADASIAGDRRAGWLLVRAYDEIFRSRYRFLRGKEWMDMALAASESEQMKLRCLEALAMGFAEEGDDRAAQSLLGSLGPQFKRPETVRQFAALEKRVLARADEVRRRQQGNERNSRERARRAHTAELRRRLESARAEGDGSKVRRYEGILKRHESEGY